MSFPVQPTIDCTACLFYHRSDARSCQCTRSDKQRTGPASHESIFEGCPSTASMLKILCLWGILTSGNGKFTHFEWKNHQFLMKKHKFLMDKSPVLNGQSPVVNGTKHQFLTEKSPVFNGKSPAFNGN